jgi:hypothetical protein
MAENSFSPARNSQFTITFDTGHTARAVCVSQNADPLWIAEKFGLTAHQPAIFISGGASYMTPEDQERTTQMIDAVADFAQEHSAVIITGGTESGVMQLIGDMRLRKHYRFPLIGVAPLGKIAYPGHANPNKEADLEDSHSHFVLVIGDEWGDESAMIVRLTHSIAGGIQPSVGILVNGGKIARNEVYLATTQQLKLPMLVLEGSGRFADELATAARTGQTNQRILQAILAGGDIHLVATVEGPEKMREKLAEVFARQ